MLGKIPNEVFRKLSDDYLAEQKEIQTTIPKDVGLLDNVIEQAAEHDEPQASIEVA